jgi:hypothetical protein
MLQICDEFPKRQHNPRFLLDAFLPASDLTGSHESKGARIGPLSYHEKEKAGWLAQRPAFIIMPVGGIIRRHRTAARGKEDDQDDECE